MKPVLPWSSAISPDIFAQTLLSVFFISISLVNISWFLIESINLVSDKNSSSNTEPLLWAVFECFNHDLSGVECSFTKEERSILEVFGRSIFLAERNSWLPISSSILETPILLIICLTSSAIYKKKLTTFSGIPLNLFLNSSFWVATPTGHLFVWQTRAIMHPSAIIATEPKPYSSAPSKAAITTSQPVLRPPSVLKITLSRKLFSKRDLWTSATPSSHGKPACLIELRGEAPVPPSWPDIWITSALALLTPAAIVPIPISETSLTLTFAFGWTWCKSWISWAKSSIE